MPWYTADIRVVVNREACVSLPKMQETFALGQGTVDYFGGNLYSGTDHEILLLLLSLFAVFKRALLYCCSLVVSSIMPTILVTSLISIFNFLSNLVNRQTDKQTNQPTNQTEHITSLAEVTVLPVYATKHAKTEQLTVSCDLSRVYTRYV